MFEQLSEIMRPPSAESMAQKEFEDASRELLKAQSAKEYAEALVTYQKARVERLSEFLKRS